MRKYTLRIMVIKEKFNESQLITIKGAGHWVHADQPDALFTALYDFLNKNNG